MKHLLTILFIFCSFFSKGQNPLVKMWDKRFGGSDWDTFISASQTSDGGFILGGHTGSGIGGDKTQASWGSFDYWIIKIDSLGNKLWDRDFGGTDEDLLFSLQQTNDGGYILGGSSCSGIGGDKSQDCWGGGGWDYWIIKIDSLGNKQWDRDFGGTSWDWLYSIQQTSDGGYILGGESGSGISGDKTQSSWGNLDYWIIKIDSIGNKEWDRDLGGTGVDRLTTIFQTRDQGYFLSGYSTSNISGDKTQNSWGFDDYWVVKTDSIGNKQWDATFGGTNSDYLYSSIQSIDGGYVIGGTTYSGIGGNKTQPLWGTVGSDWDCWIIKVDSLGNKKWEKDFGGTGLDEVYHIIQTSDGGYFVSGDSYSSISGDKTENNLGPEQSWVIKTDSIGNKQWDQTIFSSGHDESGFAIQTKDGCYAVANYSDGGIGGYKSQASQGNYDYWIVKFCEQLQANFTSPLFICPGSCIEFINHSSLATNYQWSFSGATPSTSTDINPSNICYPTPGTYDVQLIASNANGSDTLLLTNYITVYPTPPPQSITQSGDTLFAIQGSASYQWYFNTNIINGATDYFYVAPTSGDYNVVATDGNGCEVEAAVFNVNVGLTPALSKGEGVMVFPNPVGDKLMIQMSRYKRETANEISIYNVLGEMVLVQRTPFGAVSPLSFEEGQGGEADVSQLPPGLYYLEIKTSEKTFRTKFVKQ